MDQNIPVQRETEASRPEIITNLPETTLEAATRRTVTDKTKTNKENHTFKDIANAIDKENAILKLFGDNFDFDFDFYFHHNDS